MENAFNPAPAALKHAGGTGRSYPTIAGGAHPSGDFRGRFKDGPPGFAPGGFSFGRNYGILCKASIYPRATAKEEPYA